VPLSGWSWILPGERRGYSHSGDVQIASAVSATSFGGSSAAGEVSRPAGEGGTVAVAETVVASGARVGASTVADATPPEEQLAMRIGTNRSTR
jgi:hypothetical protein